MTMLKAPISQLIASGPAGARARNNIRKAWKTSPKNVPNQSAAVLAYSDRNKVGKANVQLFRHWAEHSEWIRAAINIRRDQISTAEWTIGAIDDTKPFSADLANRITLLLQNPNLRDLGWKQFIQPVVEDVLVLDAGCIEIERTLRGQIAFLHGVDGGTIRVSRIWDGNDEEPRYYWYPDYYQRASFLNQDMVYMMMNPATYRVVGLSPLETLKLTIDNELMGSEYNRRQVGSAASDGALDLGEGARPEQVEKFKTYWEAEVAGRGQMAFLGGTRGAKFIPFRQSNRDMQYLEWQTYLVRKICAVFGLTPQDLGVTYDVNRSTSEVQQENTEDRGLRPLLSLVQEHVTKEVVHDAAFGGSANNLAFEFTALNLKESQTRAMINRYALAGMPWKSVNEARRDDGRPPMEGDQFDKLVAITSAGVVILDDIPSPREVIESRKPAPGEGKPPAAGASPKKGMED